LGRHAMAVVQYTFMYVHKNKNNTMKQNTQNGTYIAKRIHEILVQN